MQFLAYHRILWSKKFTPQENVRGRILPRTDIIQNIIFGNPEHLEQFCRTIQSLSPVNGYVTPIPENIPGYEDKVIMAGGTFIEGSTIELSADGPMREPYVAYMQGGLNYAHVKICLEDMVKKL